MHHGFSALAVLALPCLLACGGGTGAGGDPEPGELGCTDSAHFVTAVVGHEFGGGQAHGQDTFPEPVLGPPLGGGSNAGGLDVTSLGEGGFVTLEFGDNWIVDGPGPDLLVFENPFQISGPEDVYTELGSVAVSSDGATWVAFECSPDEFPYPGCAGVNPVLANPDENELDPLDPTEAGGDAFDLAELGLAEARYVQISDWPEAQGGEGTFDLDAVAIVNARCP